MYLPKHQYTKKTLEELGALFDLKIGGSTGTLSESIVERITQTLGNQNTEVVVVSTGQIFSILGIDFEKGDFSNAVELVQTNEKTDPTLFDNDRGSDIKSTKLPPSSKEIKAGVMKRCFYKNTSTGKVKEVLKPVAAKLAMRRQRFEQVVCIEWKIKGPAKDQLINGYFLEGIETKNQKILDQLKEVMPGAETLINSASEYVEDTLPLTTTTQKLKNVKIDIPSPGKSILVEKNRYNKYSKKGIPGEIKENLYAEPGQFLIEGTNKEYVGPYHLHPTRGPMVGAKHVNSPHSRLVPRDKSKSRVGTEVETRVNNRIISQPVGSTTGFSSSNSTSNNSEGTFTESTSGGTTGNTSTGNNSAGYSSGGGSGGY